ncbi:MAG: hypothetical protein JSW62_00610 [Thermoplasmatales archaeon]|nr:MAG: hypothetical protein JSW62_00610 [Thermoplasmatales archaeon]
MKVIKTANGKKIKLSKSEWESIGKTAGWMKTADDYPTDIYEKYQGFNKSNPNIVFQVWSKNPKRDVWREDSTRLASKRGVFRKLITQVYRGIKDPALEIGSFQYKLVPLSSPGGNEISWDEIDFNYLNEGD